MLITIQIFQVPRKEARLPQPRNAQSFEKICSRHEETRGQSSLSPSLIQFHHDTNTIAQDTITPHNEFNKQFLDLLRRIFVYNPSKRITAKQALKHPWFREALQDDGTEAARIREEKLAKRLREAAQAHGQQKLRASGASTPSATAGAYR